MVQILRDAGLSALVADGDLGCLARGFTFTEGPLGCPDGGFLFQDMKGGRTHRLAPDGSVHLLRENTRGANGQTYTPDGRIVFCEQDGRRVSRMNRDGSAVETVALDWSGKRLNSPNDIVCRSDGVVYFTDPPYGVKPDERALHFQGVYTIDFRPSAAGQGGASPQPRLLLDDFEKPNGLAFSPDERTLYVCDTARYHVRAFDVEPSGAVRVGSGRVFARMDPESPGGPDGTKVDQEGRVYVAVAQGIWVYSQQGELLGIIATPSRPSNLAWCDRDGQRLAITAGEAVFSLRMKVPGILPPFLD